MLLGHEIEALNTHIICERGEWFKSRGNIFCRSAAAVADLLGSVNIETKSVVLVLCVSQSLSQSISRNVAAECETTTKRYSFGYWILCISS